MGLGWAQTGPYVPAALVSFFRPSGLNPTLSPYVPSGGLAFVNQVLSSEGLGGYGTIPFSDIPANYLERHVGLPRVHGGPGEALLAPLPVPSVVHVVALN